MRITKTKIAKLSKLEKELENLKREASYKLENAKQLGDIEHTLTRGGEKVKVTEKDLWEEVFRLGQNCEAGTILSKDYPEVFDAYKKVDDKAKEMEVYFADKFGFSFSQMSPSRLLRFVEAVIEYKNES
jgi:hypothetical protein